jgi:hypothetical protein
MNIRYWKGEDYKTGKKRGVLRLTGLYALRGLTAPRPPQWLGHFASLHSHAIAPAQFAGPGNATHFPIRAAKPSHTAGTLGDIGAKIYCIILNKKWLTKQYGNNILSKKGTLE